MRVNMKETEYYKSGRHIENLKLATEKSVAKSKEAKATRVAEYDKNPKLCLQCGESLDYHKQKNKFCSRSCSGTFVNLARGARSAETKAKISKSQKNNRTPMSEEHKKKACEALARGRKTRDENLRVRLLETPTENLGVKSRKEKVFNEQGNSCNRCKIIDWNDDILTFELEHIDGDRHNNLRYNLEVLCPNCHSQTKTWRGRNNKRY